MSTLAHSTNSKTLAAQGKGKMKLSMDSPAAQQLLSDCHVTSSEVQCLKDGTALINAWYALVDGKNITYCHSVKTNDNRIHIRDLNGKITTLRGGRDAFICSLLQNYLRGEGPQAESKSACANIAHPEGYLPVLEDFEVAYKVLAKPGESVSIDAILDLIESNAIKGGQVLVNDWRVKTENSIVAWSKKTPEGTT